MNIVVQRNAFHGRQLGSFYTEQNVGVGKISMTFIRGPIISSVGEGVEILATVDNQSLLRKKNMLVTSFHPELTDDARLHQYFINMCKEKVEKKIQLFSM